MSFGNIRRSWPGDFVLEDITFAGPGDFVIEDVIFAGPKVPP